MVEDEDMDSLTRNIERQREVLRSHLGQLRLRFDPRETIRAYPRAALLIAFAAGVALRRLVSRRLRRRELWLP